MCHATLNWKTIEAHMDILVLMFIWKLLSLPSSCIYNQMFINRITDFRYHMVRGFSSLRSPIHSMLLTAEKYNLQQRMYDMLDTGQMCSRARWRSIVDGSVMNMQITKWHMTCMMYKHINLAYLPRPTLLQWWIVCKERPLLVRRCKFLISLIVGTHNLGCGRGKHIRRSGLCQLCDSYVKETISHFLLECTRLHDLRSVLLTELFNVMPQAMVDSLKFMSPCKQAEFLLGEMGQTHVLEWEMVHLKIIDLVYRLCLARDHILNPS
jgi:hypothetical protein